jgi:TolB-like protein
MSRSLAVIVAGVVLMLSARQSLAESRREVAILPIVVHTLEQKQYLEAGLADMLASRMGRIPGLAVIRIQDEDHATTDLETAQKLGRDAGAEYVLFGSFTQFGEGASLDLQCAPVSAEAKGAPRSIFIQSGTLGEIIPHLDQVAEKVGSHLMADGDATGAAPGSLPAVSAAAPSGGDTPSSELLQDALSEIDALRGRVEALEQRVFAPSSPSSPADNLPGDGKARKSSPESRSDLR